MTEVNSSASWRLSSQDVILYFSFGHSRSYCSDFIRKTKCMSILRTSSLVDVFSDSGITIFFYVHIGLARRMDLVIDPLFVNCEKPKTKERINMVGTPRLYRLECIFYLIMGAVFRVINNNVVTCLLNSTSGLETVVLDTNTNFTFWPWSNLTSNFNITCLFNCCKGMEFVFYLIDNAINISSNDCSNPEQKHLMLILVGSVTITIAVTAAFMHLGRKFKLWERFTKYKYIQRFLGNVQAPRIENEPVEEIGLNPLPAGENL